MVTQKNTTRSKNFKVMWVGSIILLVIFGLLNFSIGGLILLKGTESSPDFKLPLLTGIVYLVLSFFIWKKNFKASAIATILVAIQLVTTLIIVGFSTNISLLLILLIAGSKYLYDIKE